MRLVALAALAALAAAVVDYTLLDGTFASQALAAGQCGGTTPGGWTLSDSTYAF